MKVKVCSVILIRFCMIYAYTRLRYQVSVYRTIGPLVSFGTCVYDHHLSQLVFYFLQIKSTWH